MRPFTPFHPFFLVVFVLSKFRSVPPLGQLVLILLFVLAVCVWCGSKSLCFSSLIYPVQPPDTICSYFARFPFRAFFCCAHYFLDAVLCSAILGPSHLCTHNTASTANVPFPRLLFAPFCSARPSTTNWIISTRSPVFFFLLAFSSAFGYPPFLAFLFFRFNRCASIQLGYKLTPGTFLDLSITGRPR